MDEALIRRLLGGVVLIAVAWLFAALLPPPKPVTERSEDTVVIDLRPVEVAELPSLPMPVADDEDDARAPPVPVMRESRPTPVATQAARAEPQPTVMPTPAVRANVTSTPRPTVAPTPAPQPEVAGQFWVQVGAYGTRENAEQVRESLGVAGLSARVVSADVSGRVIHRVRIGPFKNRGEAESAHARAVLLGYANAQVVGT